MPNSFTSVRRWLIEPMSVSTNRRMIIVACIAEVLLVALGVFAEAVLHHLVVLVIAAVLAVLLLIVIPVYRRLGKI